MTIAGAKLEESDNELLILEEFKIQLAALSSSEAVAGASPLIEPYIVKHNQAGFTYKLIIFNELTREWYDNSRQEASFPKYNKFDLIKTGDVVFDLGCNVGFTTLWFAFKVGAEGKVFAFDIFPWCTLAVQYNARLNGLKNVYPVNLGLGDRSDTRSIIAPGFRIHHALSLRKKPMADIHIAPLDCFSNLRPDFVKCDIEGAEYEMLTGAQRFFQRRPSIMLELHFHFLKQLGIEPSLVLRELEALGYDVYLGAPFERRFNDSVELSDNTEIYALPKKDFTPNNAKSGIGAKNDRLMLGVGAITKQFLRSRFGKK